MIRAIIIEDEKIIRDGLKKLVNEYCKDVELVGEAEGVNSGVELILKSEFDLLFLDIQMRDGTGFDLLDKIPPQLKKFKLIITTAFDQYALNAIKERAVDYLLKPVDPEDLVWAVSKIREDLESESAADSNHPKASKTGRIALATSEQIQMVDVADIIRVESSDNYSFVHMQNGRSVLISKPLKSFETELQSYGFVRIHQSHLVNVNSIQTYQRKGGSVVLKDGSELPVSTRKRESLLRLLRA